MKILIGLLLVFALGSCMGSAMTSPEVEFIKVTRTKTVTEPAPPPVEVPVLPKSCADALEYADAITAASGSMYAQGERQLDIISQARIAIASNGDLGAVEEQQRDLTGDLVGDLSDMSEAKARYDIAYDKCEKERP